LARLATRAAGLGAADDEGARLIAAAAAPPGVTLSWLPCLFDLAWAAQPHGSGHLVVSCQCRASRRTGTAEA